MSLCMSYVSILMGLSMSLSLSLYSPAKKGLQSKDGKYMAQVEGSVVYVLCVSYALYGVYVYALYGSSLPRKERGELGSSET